MEVREERGENMYNVGYMYCEKGCTSGSTTRPNMNPKRTRFRPYIHLRKIK